MPDVYFLFWRKCSAHTHTQHREQERLILETVSQREGDLHVKAASFTQKLTISNNVGDMELELDGRKSMKRISATETRSRR